MGKKSNSNGLKIYAKLALLHYLDTYRNNGHFFFVDFLEIFALFLEFIDNILDFFV